MSSKVGIKNKVLSFLILHLSFFVYSLSSVFSKRAGEQPKINLEFVICYGLVLLILVIYAVLWQQNLKRMSLITAYANKAVTVIWGLLWGLLLYNEKITVNKAIGAVVIIIGIYIVVSEKEEGK